MNITEELQQAIQLHRSGRLAEAEAIYRRVLAQDPNQSDALSMLGVIAQQFDHTDSAMQLMRRATAVRPDVPLYHMNLGNLFMELGRIDEAIDAFRAAIRAKPDLPQAYNNLGVALKDRGSLDEAIEAFHKSIELKPDHHYAHGNLLHMLHFAADSTGESLLEEHRRWARRHADPPLADAPPHANDRSPDRRLKIGYVSADLRDHPVGRFMLPVFRCRDCEQFEVVCYSAAISDDDPLRNRLRSLADGWHEIHQMTDAELAEMIRVHGVDILIDLAVHSGWNRLLAFARKPAPVQVTYLGYPGTTGMAAMDYRLTDPYLDPPGNERFYVEDSVRLPRNYWCYDAPEEAPQVGPLPASETGGLTFGCLNHFGKTGRPTIETWAEILRAAPASRLLVYALEENHLLPARDILAAKGIDRDRLQHIGRQPMREYLDMFNRIDLALDPFPCNGATTTCDALWMGAPVVTLAGQIAVHRAGVSILNNVGLPELIAHTPHRYVEIASTLSRDLDRLAELRRTLRQRMRSSPMMDAASFTRDLETAYRAMWRRWCENGS